jgi:30S ribosomal protein S31
MGKGDKRTKKGKIFNRSYGKRRPRKLKKKPTPAPKKS